MLFTIFSVVRPFNSFWLINETWVYVCNALIKYHVYIIIPPNRIAWLLFCFCFCLLLLFFIAVFLCCFLLLLLFGFFNLFIFFRFVMICLLLVVLFLREGVGMYYILYLFVNLWNSLHIQIPFGKCKLIYRIRRVLS
jgi:hypothetical protein